jgi:hypothetical protein
MSAGRHRLACLIAVAALAAPSAAWAQGAGDEQYQDPFGGDDQSQSQGSGDQDTQGSSGGGGGETAQATPTPTPAPSTPTTPATTTAQASAVAQQLPRTGGDPTPQVIAGVLLLAGGVVLRVRLRPR